MNCKKIFTVLLIIIMSLSCVACSGSKADTMAKTETVVKPKIDPPETVVKNYLNSLQKMDFENAMKYVDTSGDLSEFNKDSDEYVYIEKIMNTLSYSIISSSENEDTSTVKATIKNIDMSSVMSDVLTQAFELSFSGVSGEDLDVKVNEIIKSSVDSNKEKQIENEVDINLKKTETGWIIITDDSLQDAITGGLISYIKSFGNSSSDSSAENENTTSNANTYDGQGTLGDYNYKIKDYFLTTDYNGKDAVVVTFDFTNNAADATSFYVAALVNAFQDGIELDSTYISGDDRYDSNSDLKEIKNGATLEVQKAYLLRNNDSPVEIELENLLSLNSDKIAKTFNIK